MLEPECCRHPYRYVIYITLTPRSAVPKLTLTSVSHPIIAKMPVRIPKARGTEILSFGVAGVGAFAPLYLILPGAEERLATQTARWAPRWERNINYITPPVQRSIQRVTPRVEKAVKKLDERLPLEKVAKRVDSNIKRGINKVMKQ